MSCVRLKYELERLCVLINILKFSVYLPPVLTFCPHSVFMSCMDLRTNSDYFPIQH